MLADRATERVFEDGEPVSGFVRLVDADTTDVHSYSVTSMPDGEGFCQHRCKYG
ncbi:hypothetical protein ACLKMH_14955 [Psychromonas sp. KJ10-10]|uniref:hypothetical protein n=1 Tax=Psychromonas sp. KJ10-10 TaxID=3391823 RepID=UPI0039B60570